MTMATAFENLARSAEGVATAMADFMRAIDPVQAEREQAYTRLAMLTDPVAIMLRIQRDLTLEDMGIAYRLASLDQSVDQIADALRGDSH